MEAGQINSILRRKENIENSIINKENLNYEERIDKIMKKVDEILEYISCGDLAKKLLNNELGGKTASEIRAMTEEEMEQLCDPYDPAVVAAICIRLKEKEGEVKGEQQ